MKNPFEFKTPDKISAKDVVELFEPVFSEYSSVPLVGHTFINGARGSGKSMMFRFMMPECQILVNKEGVKLDMPRKITELDYFSIFLPVKKGQLNKTDIELNNNHGDALINEHYMVLYFSIIMFKELSKLNIEDNELNRKSLLEYYNNVFHEELSYSGFDEKLKKEIQGNSKIKEIFTCIIKTLRELNSTFQTEYINRLSLSKEPVAYKGPILLYNDFLTEIIAEFRQLPFMPNDKPIFLLIDDADELSVIQRKILNSWVSNRSTDVISLKISTQLKYKIFSTLNGSRIDTPHDYSEININDIYTSKKDIYYNRVKGIVERRLNWFANNNTDCMTISKDSEMFFPESEKQKATIDKLFKETEVIKLKESFSEKQAYDFAYRYTTPDYIKNLSNNYTYSYSGFKNLVHISSGIIREFIDFSSKMFEAMNSKNKGNIVEFIQPSIQNKVIREFSEKKLVDELDRYKGEALNKSDFDKLRNLINSMGGLFKMILLSNESERRVFSIALNDEPSDDLKAILDLGVSTGYLQKSMIGNKEGTGRARLYILSRVLAPFFGLDPTSFAGYKFMDSAILELALNSKEKFLNHFKKKLKIDDENQIEIKYEA